MQAPGPPLPQVQHGVQSWERQDRGGGPIIIVSSRGPWDCFGASHTCFFAVVCVPVAELAIKVQGKHTFVSVLLEKPLKTRKSLQKLKKT